MEKMKFRKFGRMWIREDLSLYIEVPADIKDIDMEKSPSLKPPLETVMLLE